MSFGRLPLEVQQIQSSSPLLDIYTHAPEVLKSRPLLQHKTLELPHGHPSPKRWISPGGWGARHINDNAPFSLWDATTRTYRMPSQEELKWLRARFGDGAISQPGGWFMTIETINPPKLIPLTIGCMPVMFTAVGEDPLPLTPDNHYSNPRIPDPCAEVSWEPMTFPTVNHNVSILEALQPIANVCSIIYMPYWTIVELEYNDGRVYEAKSLPGTVGNRTTLYHHEETPWHKKMSQRTLTRTFDPAQHQSGASMVTSPQDRTNYLKEFSFISPGCRLESGFGTEGSLYERVNAGTSAGVKIRNHNGTEVLTVSHHGFLGSNDVFHPTASGEKVGEVIDTRPELDISLVKLTPEALRTFKNDCYFQAETPRVLLNGADIKPGSWAEVDGMSSGLISLMAYAPKFIKPKRPPGHPDIKYRHWKVDTVSAVFGVVNAIISDGMCGAPIVDCKTGGVQGFFHLSDGLNCYAAHLDDLVAEGWEIA
ncbi:hypothetical protein VC83_03350 [Pseudogymnoascus destructans]|uniref:Uncharacterized protein n=2 Tax=Pseudogymnoascus destructans TaxID=655981 RepID=L8G1P3_PSED2|nr:uncharacterized protein VC83_03350 [Pseudogymnoascus destructans]ELR07047.1 hypothetical protein GMDG_08225 [Pseudogymnoascus destructans 20631-21]OAF60707.1 hypothetical protein VC83_03350 [Pseudogymnoascus destructans]